MYLYLDWLPHNSGGREVTYISISSISPPPLPHRFGLALSGLCLCVASYCADQAYFHLLSMNHLKDFSFFLTRKKQNKNEKSDAKGMW